MFLFSFPRGFERGGRCLVCTHTPVLSWRQAPAMPSSMPLPHEARPSVSARDVVNGKIQHDDVHGEEAHSPAEWKRGTS